MSKAFLIDVAKCSGCRSCQVSCKDEFCEQPWLPYSEAQPLTGSFWCNVEERERGRTPKVTVTYKPVICNHCDDCVLMRIAPDAVYRRDDGLVIIDPQKARGRRDLVDACPLGTVYYNEALDVPQKCTGCAHLLDDGWSVPRCVDSCAHEAVQFAEESELMQNDEAWAIFVEHYPAAVDKTIMKTVASQTLKQFHNAHSDEISAEALADMDKRLRAIKVEREVVISADLPINELAANEAAAAVVEELFPGFLANEEVMGQAGDKSFKFLSAIMPDAIPAEAVDALGAKLRAL